MPAAEDLSPLLDKLRQLAEATRHLVNQEQADTLGTLISNISAHLRELAAFQAEHPDKIWVDINQQVNQLDVALAHVAERQKQVLADLLKTEPLIGKILSTPSGAPPVSGDVAAMAQILRLQKQINDAMTEGDISGDWLAAQHAAEGYQKQIDEITLRTGTMMDGLRVGLHEYEAAAKRTALNAHDAMLSAAHGMEAAMTHFLSLSTLATKGVGAAFAELGQNMLQAILDALAQMVAQWIIAHTVMALISKLFGKTAGKDESATVGDSASKSAMARAFEGAATAYAFWAWDPPQAAAYAALAFGFGSAMAAGAKAVTGGGAGVGGMTLPFATGGLVTGPSGIDVIPARLTVGEYVLNTSAVSLVGTRVLDAINSGGKGMQLGGLVGAVAPLRGVDTFNNVVSRVALPAFSPTPALARAGGSPGGSIAISLRNSYSISALDKDGVEDVLRRHETSLMRTIARAVRHGNIKIWGK